jgi:predicted nucleic acid-binding Zn ribbon protein
MDRFIDDRGWSTDVSLRVLLGRWPTLVGAANAAHSTPAGYCDGVLTVRTESTVWATSLRAIASQLVAKLNDELGDGAVTRIEVRGPQAPNWKRGRRTVRGGRGPRDTYG